MSTTPAVRRSDALLASLKTLHPLSIDLSLGRIEHLLTKLGHPERKLPPVVHIAGTNGKGSTTAYLRAIAEAAGKRPHVYTSPHLVHFHERIVLAQPGGGSAPISEGQLVALLERVRDVNAGAPITFFEITTAAAFLAFSETPADVLILEVGLGGEFDTTNVVQRPQLCIITPISIDHAEKLGGSLESIAWAKAGIIKRDVPVVISQQGPEVLDVLRAKARAERAPLLTWGEDFDAFEQNGRLIFQTENELLDLPLPGLVGRHQIVNAGTVVAAAQQLRALLGLDENIIGRGLAKTVWPGRMQRLATGLLAERAGASIELWLDGGHNPAGGHVIAQTLADLDEVRPMPVVMIFGMQGHRDAGGFLLPFAGIVQHVLTVPVAGAREMPHDPADLAKAARGVGMPAEAYADPLAAIDHLARTVTTPTRVLICGSLYLAGAVLAVQAGETPQAN
jgi:dihydrofolate synthase / folylpolyglutamate synthase